MAGRIERTAQVYDKIATNYSRKKANEYSLEELGKFNSLLTPNSSILSAGCGAGRDANVFQQSGHRVIGVDISENLLRIASSQHPQTPFVLGDMRRNPFPDTIFNGVWAHESIHHLDREDIAPTLLEFNRLLIPGGIVSILTRQGVGDVEVKEAMSSGQTREYTLLEPDELDILLMQSGFTKIELYTFNEMDRKPAGRYLEWISAFYRK